MQAAIACAEYHAGRAGGQVLDAGGNCVDAAVAAAFVQGVTNPVQCGIGGTGSLYIWDRKAGRDVYLDFEGEVGSNPIPRTWKVDEGRLPDGPNSGNYRVHGKFNEFGPGSVLLPGFVRGTWDAYQKYGSTRLSWAELLEPAIRLARDGFDVPPYSASIMRIVRQLLGSDFPDATNPDAAAVYARAPGETHDVGDRLVQADLGRTLARLAEAGGEDFYSGDIAREISRHFGDRSTITADDLANYRTLEDPPIRGEYRGMQVTAQPFANGSQLISGLHILERLDAGALQLNSARYVELVAAVMRASFEEYSRGDHGGTDRHGSLDADIIATADTWAQRLRADPRAAVGLARPETPPGRGTTQLVVVDADGAIASMNHSIGMSGAVLVTPGLGFVYNNFMRFFDPRPGAQRSAEPGRRMGGASSLAFFADGSPRLILGGAGGTRIATAILQTVLNVVDHGMDPQTAVAVPRFHSQAGTSIYMEPQFDDDVAAELPSMGWTVHRSRYQARVQAVRVRQEPDAGVDPRSQSLTSYPLENWTTDPAFS